MYKVLLSVAIVCVSACSNEKSEIVDRDTKIKLYIESNYQDQVRMLGFVA